MRIAIFLSSLGGSPLQGGIERGLQSLGHSVEPYHRGRTYDLVVVFQQVAHDPSYRWPDHFPDARLPIAFVDSAEFGYFCRLPDRCRRWVNSFTPDAIAHDTKNRHEQIRLKSFLEGRSFPYFIREKLKCVNYPASYYPIDYPLYHLSDCTEEPNREQYLKRDLDLFSWWGMSHPWRVKITENLRDAHVKAEIGDRWGDGNMNQCCYFQRMSAAKCSVSYDGYGSGSFRMTEVLVRTLLLQGPLQIETRCPLVDGETCRTYTVENEGEEFLGTNIREVLTQSICDPEGSFEIYRRGYEHCRTNLSERATAQYLVDTVYKHDWTVNTPLTGIA